MSVAVIAEEPRRGGDSGWLTTRAGGSGCGCAEARVCADGIVTSPPAEVGRLRERAIAGRLLSRFRVSEVCAGIAGLLASMGLSQVWVLSGLKTGLGAAINPAARALKPRVGSLAAAEVATTRRRSGCAKPRNPRGARRSCSSAPGRSRAISSAMGFRRCSMRRPVGWRSVGRRSGQTQPS
jgi:hypothetical protein